MKPLFTHRGKRLELLSKYSWKSNVRSKTPLQSIFEPYEITYYEDCITIRTGGGKEGANFLWMPLSDVSLISESDVEGYQTIVLEFGYVGPGCSLPE